MMKALAEIISFQVTFPINGRRLNILAYEMLKLTKSNIILRFQVMDKMNIHNATIALLTHKCVYVCTNVLNTYIFNV